jgi:hypothetical protein
MALYLCGVTSTTFEEINMENDKAISTGLAFMQAAAAAMPKSLGDRDRISAMCEAMQLAVRNRFAFAKQDAEALKRLAIITSVGKFRPLDYYGMACIYGGTYARMWEAHHGQQPWVARKAITPEHVRDGLSILDNNRVAVGMGVLLPQSMDIHDPATLPVDGMQVWWVTGMSDDFVRVCRYRLTPSELANRNRSMPFQHQNRAPFRIRTLMREEWDELNTAPPEEKQAA